MDVQGKILSGIGIVILVIFFLSLTSTVVDQVADIITASSGWTFTGHEGAAALLGLVPFVWVAAILLLAVVGMVEIARS